MHLKCDLARDLTCCKQQTVVTQARHELGFVDPDSGIDEYKAGVVQF